MELNKIDIAPVPVTDHQLAMADALSRINGELSRVLDKLQPQPTTMDAKDLGPSGLSADLQRNLEHARDIETMVFRLSSLIGV